MCGPFPAPSFSTRPAPCWLASSWVWLVGDTSIMRPEEKEIGAYLPAPWLMRGLGFSSGCIRGSPASIVPALTGLS